jgi:signal transduction histidine kinase
MIKEKALAHGISLDIDTAEDLEGLEITADERKIKQVMFNLLSNAAKFTPDGGAITVNSRKEGKELIISVTDAGIGIPLEEQGKIFEEFYQTAASMNNKTPGTGLGLPLTKGIVEMHNGKIWVESEGLDKGSRFTFTLPL